MRIVYKRCCGMDVHKKSVTACVLVIDEDGEFRKQSRYFSTMTRDLKEMATLVSEPRSRGNCDGGNRSLLERRSINCFW
jgi:transposase